MRMLVQRVSEASVDVDGSQIARIGAGLLIYLGVRAGDSAKDVEFLSGKVRYLRIFPDSEGKSNLDVTQAGGSILLVSNFTLAADTSQGRRPAFTSAADPVAAEALYHQMCTSLRGAGLEVQTGRFGAMMEVRSVNRGPANYLLDSRDREP